MSLSQLLYISDATTGMCSADLNRLVAKCQKKNNECNITGLLLYSAGHFIQLLEGHQPVIANTFARISKDPRHQHVQQLHFEPCKERLFGKWQMGLLNLDDVGELDRSRLTELVGLLRDKPSAATILSAFREFRSQLPASDAKQPAILASA